MTIPTYPTGTGTGKLNSTHANQIINAINGFSASGTFRAPYTFLVTTDGTDAYASNAFQTVYGGASDAGSVDGGDAAAVIQAALDNLTVGRSWYETVAVRGSFAISTTLTVSAYTILDLSNALLTATAPFTGTEIVKVNGLNVVVTGGLIDGNEIDVHGIKGFYGNLTVKDIEVFDCGYNCVSVWAADRNCQNITFQNITAHNTVATGWPPLAVTNCGDGSFTVTDANFTDCLVTGTAHDVGFLVEGTCSRVTFNHCTAIACATCGFFDDNTIDVYTYGNPTNIKYVNCNAYNNIGPGFAAEGDYEEYVNCHAEANGWDGYFVMALGSHAKFTNCVAVNNGDAVDADPNWGRRNGLYLEAGATYVNIEGCTLIDTQGAGSKTQEYAIRVGAGCDYVWIGKDQNLTGNSLDYLWIDSTATHISLPNFTLPFIIGSPTAGPYTVANYEFEGWEVDDAAEFVATYFTLPAGLTHIIDVTVDAYSVVTETHGMQAQFVLYGGAANEAQNTHDANAASLTSNTTNFAAADNIKWVFTNANDARLDDFSAGDSCRLHMIYAAASGANCATDARFKSVTVRYV